MMANCVCGVDKADAWFYGHWLVAQAQRRELLAQPIQFFTLPRPSVALRIVFEPILLTGSFTTAPHNSG